MNREGHKIIEVGELTKRFGDLTAVNRVSFSVNQGELFGFLGPNGAGPGIYRALCIRKCPPYHLGNCIGECDVEEPLLNDSKIGAES